MGSDSGRKPGWPAVDRRLPKHSHAVYEKKQVSGDDYEPRVWVSTGKEDGRVVIRIADNGPGIPPDTLDRVFEPFFTTKPTGSGTGLGLSLSYEIVTKGHGGELMVASEDGEGAVFIVKLS